MHIMVAGLSQQLRLMEGSQVLKTYTISTGAAGFGEQNGSYKTPTGHHIVRAKIGQNLPQGAVFIKRRFTGEIFTPALFEAQPGRDWILSRILWLSGCEKGKNRLGPNDTMRRFIYIHGAAPQRPLGTPNSKGCIRMDCRDIIELYNSIPVGISVFIDPTGT